MHRITKEIKLKVLKNKQICANILKLGGIGGQEEKGTKEDEMAGWHHQLDGHEFKWTPGVGDGQGGLACWDSGVAESDTTEQLNWNDVLLY